MASVLMQALCEPSAHLLSGAGLQPRGSFVACVLASPYGLIPSRLVALALLEDNVVSKPPLSNAVNRDALRDRTLWAAGWVQMALVKDPQAMTQLGKGAPCRACRGTGQVLWFTHGRQCKRVKYPRQYSFKEGILMPFLFGWCLRAGT
eukprot:scaffold308449_cov18-Tisochrysis_lutea.AAC.1